MSNMKVVVFGGTGAQGRSVVQGTYNHTDLRFNK
jgi:hypothetical protein